MRATFVAACHSPVEFPLDGLFEIAVAGRSNCGKSSLINALSRQNKLARTSSAPGRTRQIVYFRCEPKQQRPFYLVDLPGYGFAKVSKAEKAHWGALIGDYIDNRPALGAILLLCDIRRGPQKEELDLVAWAQARELEQIVVLTKADKLAKSRRFGAVAAAKKAYGLRPSPLTVSVNDRASIDSLREAVLALARRGAASLSQ